jgi:hypothetical protein
VEFLIDQEGQPMRSWDITTRDAVWKHGFIHVGIVGTTVVVSLCPSLAQGVTLAGSFDEIARLDPTLVALRTESETAKIEVFRRHADAFHRMWGLVADVGNVKAYPRSTPSRVLASC